MDCFTLFVMTTWGFVMRKIVLFVLISVSMFTVTVFADTAGFASADTAVYKSKSTSSSRMHKLSAGEQVAITARAGKWFAVKASGKSGFVETKNIRLTQTDAKTTAVLNIRSKPSAGSDKLGQFQKGEKITLYGLCGDFYMVMHQGKSAYVHMDYVKGDFLDLLPSLPADEENLDTFAEIKQNWSIVPETAPTIENFNVKKLGATDLTIAYSYEPKILIFHTHASEMYKDSNPDEPMDGIVGVGERLANYLRENYGIGVIHSRDVFDRVDGELHILGAYDRMTPVIEKILKEHPSIEVVIDLHRDGVPENQIYTKTINGEKTAQIMFVNGISSTLANGRVYSSASIPNPHVFTNLAFSYQMHKAIGEACPGLTRKIYVTQYRYSLSLAPKTLLIEVGAQNNTMAEAFSAVEPIAKGIAKVILGKQG